MDTFLYGFALFVIIALMIHIIGTIADGAFMEWTEYFKKKWKMSNFVAGETIQALGTSAPEISISIIGLYILGENPALGMATIIGSAVFQITIVIGVPILLAEKSAKLDPKGLLRTASVYGGSVVLLWIFVQTGNVLVWWELAILSVYHLTYMYFLLSNKPKGEIADNTPEHDESEIENKTLLLRWLDKFLNLIPSPKDKWGIVNGVPIGFIITLLAIGVSSYVFVDMSVSFAELLGISSTLIALTVLAGGSSMPELFSNIPLAKKGNIDQAIGNAFGSNTLDICISFALMSIPYALFTGSISGAEIESMMIPIMFLFGYLFLVLLIFAVAKFETRKWQGWVLIALFIIFVAVNAFYVK
ncbi:TPA: sodium:calcium antiporter [Candidatus Peregrinibacteria bacterium]|nr:sodium:calcium antiporter [Candidatus Peregrinibacteria bacterium]HIQ57251.1 sodium:calcium antiporter [Candidatus Gracilibacteria bacterium]